MSNGIPFFKVGLQRWESGAFEYRNRDVAPLAEETSGLIRGVVVVNGQAIANARRLSANSAAARLFGKPRVVLLDRDAVSPYHRSAVYLFPLFRSMVLVEVGLPRRGLAPFPHVGVVFSTIRRMWHSMIVPSFCGPATRITP